MNKKQNYLSVGMAFTLMLLLLLFTEQAKNAAVSALQLCATTLLPSIFPFYVAANLLVFIGLPSGGRKAEAIMQLLFRLPGKAAPALLLGLLGGYPIGAATTAALYKQGVLTKKQAIHLSAFSNNAGPAFIIGAAGLAVFHSVKLGFLLFLIHAVSAICTGMILRPKCNFHAESRPMIHTPCLPIGQALPKAVSATVQSMLIISAYVVFFSVILSVIEAVPFINAILTAITKQLPAANALLSGFVELSCGILSLRNTPPAAALICASILLGWGGICVFFQGASVLYAADLPVKQCCIGKMIQALIAGALTCLYCAVYVQKVKFMFIFVIFSLFLAYFVKFRGRKKENSLI